MKSANVNRIETPRKIRWGRNRDGALRAVGVVLVVAVTVLGLVALAMAAASPVLDFDLGQVSGTTVTDTANGVVGNTHGTLWSTDASGQPVLYFDNPIDYTFHDGDYFEIPDHAALDSASFSVEVVVYPMSTGYYTTFLERITDSGSFEQNLWMGLASTGYTTGTNPTFGVRVSGVAKSVAATPGIALNEWSHIVGTYDGADLNLYVDGSLVATATGVGGPRDGGSKPLYLGHAPTSNHYFNGYFAHFKMYDRVLTAQEVAASAAPTVSSDVQTSYVGAASIEITATDVGYGPSGIRVTSYNLDDGGWVDTPGATATVNVDTPGTYTIQYRAEDYPGNRSSTVTSDFTVKSDSTDYTALAGATRYNTAVMVSKEAYPSGTNIVVIATAANWPDALGGAALAGAADGPILLVTKDSIPTVVQGEIDRLGATKAYVLGGIGAVSQAVEDSLISDMGAGSVTRLGGASRYGTANLIAQETIDVLGIGYDGGSFVATGRNFPDALAGSPLAASAGMPIFLATADAAPAAEMKAMGVTDVLVLGGTGAVAGDIETALEGTFGGGNVDRLAGSDRYSTGVAIATYGVDSLGLSWNHLAIATGRNFPDALAGGVLPATNGSVMLLSAATTLPSSVATALSDNKDWIADVYYLGGLGAVPQSVRDAVAAQLH